MTEISIINWPDRSAFLGDLLFFSIYSDFSDHTRKLVVYGNTTAPSSNYLAELCRLFPDFDFIVFGALASDDTVNSSITYISDQFTQNYSLNSPVTFCISNIPECLDWIHQVNPKYLYMDYGTSEPQFAGTLYWSIWVPSAAESTRMVLKTDSTGNYIPEVFNSLAYATARATQKNVRISNIYTNPSAYGSELLNDYDSTAEAQILKIYYSKLSEFDLVARVIAGSIGITQALKTPKYPNLQTLRANIQVVPFVLRLANALLTRNFVQIHDLLCSNEFLLDNSKYQWLAKNAFFFRDRLHNDSGLLMRAAVGSGSYGVVKLVLLEESIDPSAMDNIALQDAIISKKQDIIQLLAAAKTIRCPKFYNTAPTPWSVYEIFRQGLDILNSKYYKLYDSSSKQLVRDTVFIDHYRLNNLKNQYNLKHTQFHRALLATYQDTQHNIYYVMLCESSSMRQRQDRQNWHTST